MQVARVGLVNAVIRFDVDAGSDFVSFAVPTIMGEVRRHFRDNSWSVKVPRRLKELHLRLGAATAELSQRLGRAPTATELAAELGDGPRRGRRGPGRGQLLQHAVDRQRWQRQSRTRPRSPTRWATSTSSLDQIENREALRPLLEALPERERTVLVLQVLRVADSDADRRAGRHLADARVAAAGEVASAAPRPAGVAAAVRPEQRDSARRHRRATGNVSRDRRSAAAGDRGAGHHRPPDAAPAHRTLSVCSAEKPAVPKKSTPVRSRTRRWVLSAWRSA